MVAADWLRSDKREDDLGGRPDSIVQVLHFLLLVIQTLRWFSNLYFIVVYIMVEFYKFSYAEICSARWTGIFLHCEHTGKPCPFWVGINLNACSLLVILVVVTIYQVPGSTTYSLALYYMMNTRLEDSPLLESFVKGDDAFRNSRFKLIPYISKVRNASDTLKRPHVFYWNISWWKIWEVLNNYLGFSLSEICIFC